MRETLRALALWVSITLRASPFLAILNVTLTILTGAAVPLSSYAIKLVIDGLTGSGQGSVTTGVALLVGSLVLTFAGNLLTHNIQLVLNDRLELEVHSRLLAITTSIPGLAHHERPEVSDKLALVQQRALQMSGSTGQLMFAITTIVNALTVLVLLGSVHLVLLVLPAIGMTRVWARLVNLRMFLAVVEHTTPHQRLGQKLLDVAEAPRHGLEIRVFGRETFLLNRIDELFRHRFTEQRRAVRRGALVEGGARLGYFACYVAAIVWLIIMARSGDVSVGQVGMVILLAPQVDAVIGGVSGNANAFGNLARLFANVLWLRDYAEDNAWSGGTAAVPDRLRKGIELCGVSFAYPGTDLFGLRDVNLRLPAGSTVALVGENGAGKTTLVKLLLRLYDPTSGQVLVDGHDLRELDVLSWRARVSASFQDYARLEFLVRESVGVGDVPRLDNRSVVLSALERADGEGVVSALSHGLDTQLGKRFTDGAELSGGQWQRLALARAFMRDRPLLLVLDEPTAALDPEAEHALFEGFAAASRTTARESGGITVLVSHRFSTVRMADLIIVLHEGRVWEAGTHEELMAAGGRYADLFALQARSYR